MKTIQNIACRLLIMTPMVLLWISCKDDDQELNLPRRFQPADFDITGGETSATIKWNESLFTIPGEVEYKIELSKDPDFSTIDVTKTTTETEVSVLDTEIDIKTDYYARVQALGKGNVGDSNWLISEPFQITGEIFILPIFEYDILITEVLIKWIPGKDVGKIIVTPEGGSAIEVVVSGTEAAAGQKLVEGLAQNTLYTVELQNGEGVSKGGSSFRTKPSYEGSNIIDLRGITGNPKILRDTLQDVAAGSIIWLKRGEIYTIDNTDNAALRVIGKSVTIMSGPELNPEFAKIHLTTNFNFVASSSIDSVVFKDLVFKGVRAGGASFDNDYVINSNVVATVGTIRLENCKISRLRGTVRAQTASTGTKIANYFINNCVIDSIREFAVVMASASSSFANVKISNSTFYRCRRFVNHGVAGNNSLVVENCTFNELPTGGPAGAPVNYFIDFTTSHGTVIEVKDCIIGKTWIETAGNTDAGGIRASGTASITVTNTYVLSDFVSTVASVKIPGVIEYPATSENVFTDPGNGIFTVKDASFPGRTNAGDPRWR